MPILKKYNFKSMYFMNIIVYIIHNGNIFTSQHFSGSKQTMRMFRRDHKSLKFDKVREIKCYLC